jgi:hypothetical protein
MACVVRRANAQRRRSMTSGKCDVIVHAESSGRRLLFEHCLVFFMAVEREHKNYARR